MAVTLEGILRFFNSILHLPSFFVFCAYLLMIWMSPVWKRITKPLDLRQAMVVYNFGLSMLSVYTLTRFANGIYNSQDIFSTKYSSSLQNTFYAYWICKVIELLDTVFMIVRHKQRQISFLHVYHHSTMLLLSDYAYRLTPWPAIAPFLTLNSFVHVILYFYYGLSALYPNNPPAWKKQLTQMQILQFVVLFLHALYGYLYHGFCIYGLLYGMLMTGLFVNFYLRAYSKSAKCKLENTVQNGKQL